MTQSGSGFFSSVVAGVIAAVIIFVAWKYIF